MIELVKLSLENEPLNQILNYRNWLMKQFSSDVLTILMFKNNMTDVAYFMFASGKL